MSSSNNDIAINDNKMSLSMKMRVQSMRIPNKSRLDIFPSILINDNSISPIKSPKTFKDNMKGDILRTPNQYERLSGTLDFMASGGVFPDRTTIVHPVAVCVRCSGNAAMCMPCTELLCQESLTFYRKTRAIGAASLFQRAVTEAGLTKLMKFAVFRMWLNYLKKIKILRKRRIKIADHFYFMKGAQIPFFAWRSFVKSEVLERKDKTIQDLRDRIAAMEGTFNRVQFEKANTAKQIKQLQSDLSASEREVKSQQKTIESLEKTISIEQQRVIGLSSLSRPLIIFSKLIDSLKEWQISDLNIDYLSNRKNDINGYNFNRIFTDEKYIKTLIQKQMNQQSARFSSLNSKYSKEISGENMDVEFMLIKWSNNMIEEAGLLIEKHSQKYLEAFIPGSDVPRTFTDFSDGFQLVRIILCLIVQCYNYHSTSLSQEELDQIYPTIEEFDMIKKAKNSTEKVLPIALNLGIKYLGLPIFKAEEIIDGKIELIRAVIAFLFLIASPSRFNEDNDILIKEYSDFNHLLQDIEEINEETKRKDMLIELQNVWGVITNTSIDIDFNPPSNNIMEEELEINVNGDILSENKKEDDEEEINTEVNNIDENNKDTKEVIIESIEENKISNDIKASYSDLCEVIDKFLSTEVNTLPISSIKIGQVMYKLKQFKEKIQKTIYNEKNGHQLGRLVRSHVIKHFTSNLLHQGKFINED